MIDIDSVEKLPRILFSSTDNGHNLIELPGKNVSTLSEVN